MRVPRSGIAVLSAVALAAVFVGDPVHATAASVADTGTAQPAVWTAKSANFVFSGFTTKYSCEGLRDKVRQALLQLGARKDLRVTEGACTRVGAPEPFPNVDIHVNVLEPAHAVDSGSTDAHVTTVPAHWKRVELVLDKDPLWQAEDCELLEQIKHRVLPLFATRNVEYESSCVAHQVSPGGTWLRAQVLVPDQAAPQGAERH